MKTATKTSMLSIKVDPKVKSEAQKVADALGFSLSAIINASLKNLVSTRSVSFTVHETPNPMLKRAIKEARKSRARGESFGPFSPAEANDFLRSRI